MRHLGSSWNPLMAGADSIDATDSLTTPRNASDTDMAPPRLRSGERTMIGHFILSQPRPVARQGKKQQLQVNAKANPINIGV
jgi:hypothetical protein